MSSELVTVEQSAVRAFPTVLVLERNARVGKRIARVIAAAAGLRGDLEAGDEPSPVALLDHAGDLRQLLSPHTRLIACGEDDLDRIADMTYRALPARAHEIRLIAWSAADPQRALQVAHQDERISNLLGWADYQSMPRPWELAMATRRLLFPTAPAPQIAELCCWGGSEQVWTPRTSVDRDRVVAEVGGLALACGAPARLADRVAESAYELLMNAIYDAPVDADGAPRYALDRTQEVVLDAAEVPVVRVCTDGMMLAVEVADPFGRLARGRVFESVLRGFHEDTQRVFLPSRNVGNVIDPDRGGAGLGLHRVYATSAALVCDVAPDRETRVIAFHNLDVTPREARSTPGSLHYFAR